jgi:hypothetical protein
VSPFGPCAPEVSVGSVVHPAGHELKLYNSPLLTFRHTWIVVVVPDATAAAVIEPPVTRAAAMAMPPILLSFTS